MHTSPEIYHTPQKAFIISTYPYLCYSNSRLNSPQGNVNQVTFGAYLGAHLGQSIARPPDATDSSTS